MIGKYIRSKYKSVLLFALFLGVFCLVSYLYRIPADALIYACVLCPVSYTHLDVYKRQVCPPSR